MPESHHEGDFSSMNPHLLQQLPPDLLCSERPRQEDSIVVEPDCDPSAVDDH